MVTKKALIVFSALFLASCSYKIMDRSAGKAEHTHTKVSCSYAPLWLAPLNSDYADVSKIVQGGKVVSVEQKVYPFVLFTKSCVKVTYTH